MGWGKTPLSRRNICKVSMILHRIADLRLQEKLIKTWINLKTRTLNSWHRFFGLLKSPFSVTLFLCALSDMIKTWIHSKLDNDRSPQFSKVAAALEASKMLLKFLKFPPWLTCHFRGSECSTGSAYWGQKFSPWTLKNFLHHGFLIVLCHLQKLEMTEFQPESWECKTKLLHHFCWYFIWSSKILGNAMKTQQKELKMLILPCFCPCLLNDSGRLLV